MQAVQNLSEENLLLSHLDEFKEAISRMQSRASEYCFSNLYLFRKQHDYRVLRKGGFLFLQGVTYDGVWFIMPFSPLNEIGEPLLAEIMSDGFALYPVETEELEMFSEDKYVRSFNRDDSDYIYLTERIKLYPGRNLSKKRNLVKQYRTLYEYRDVEYTCDHKNDAKLVLDKWLEMTGLDVADTDYDSCMESIEQCEIFGLEGQIYYASNEPSGLLFGEKLNEKMFVIHFAKGLTNFKGIYQHMYSSLASTLDSDYELLNFEQDLGKDSLRQAKSTYIQDFMVDKYRVSLK